MIDIEIKILLYIISFYHRNDMVIQSIKKYTINRQKAKLSKIVVKTRIRTSKIVKFRKHIGQILRERIPVIAPLQELISGK